MRAPRPLAAPGLRAAPPARAARRTPPRPPRAAGDDPSLTSTSTTAEHDDTMASTLSALDAVLGIEPDAPPAPDATTDASAPRADVSFSPDVLKALAEAEAGRAAARGEGGGAAPSTPPSSDALGERMARLADAAKKVAAADGDDPASERELRAEFEKLAALVGNPGGADKADLAAIKDAVFGPRVFWVTDTSPLDPFVADGWLVRGNLRTDRAAAFAAVAEGVATLFGDKYVVLMVEDPPVDGAAEDEGVPRVGADGAPRVAFQIVTAAAAGPAPSPRWQPLAGAVLGALTVGSALQLGVAANVFRLPPEILRWLGDPAGLAPGPDGGLPDFVADFDPSPLLGAALPIAAAVVAVQAAHEVGHKAAGAVRGIRSGLPLFVPNGQLGTFGAITQLRSLAADRAALLDFALAGPAAGGALAAVLFFYGLAASAAGASTPSPDLIPIPAALLQGSLLLGGVAKAALAGAASTPGGAILVHPTVVAGWAGLVATALNCLPVGRLDGGRATLAAFGTSALAVTSFLTYVGLALGLLGSALALPFGLYVLICQREPEATPRDGVTPPSSSRQVAAAVAVGLALLILLPSAPDVADAVASGPGAVGGGMFL